MSPRIRTSPEGKGRAVSPTCRLALAPAGGSPIPEPVDDPVLMQLLTRLAALRMELDRLETYVDDHLYDEREVFTRHTLRMREDLDQLDELLAVRAAGLGFY